MATRQRRVLPLRRTSRGCSLCRHLGRDRYSRQARRYVRQFSILLRRSATDLPSFDLAAAGGAYRPPHARGTLTPTLFKREDEGGAAYNPTNGTNNFPSQGNSGRTSPSFQSRGRRTIPGAVAAPDAEEPATSRRKKKGGDNKKKGGENGSGAATPTTPLAAPVPVVAAPVAAAAVLEAEVALSANDKKRRALNKKILAIEQ